MDFSASKPSHTPVLINDMAVEVTVAPSLWVCTFSTTSPGTTHFILGGAERISELPSEDIKTSKIFI